MSRVIVALGSFISGVFITLLCGSIFGPQLWMIVQPEAIAQSGTGGAIRVPGKIPVVPELPKSFSEELRIISGTHQLDGLHCVRCTFQDATLRYGGGPIKLEDCQFAGTIRVELQGAARNGNNLITLVRTLGSATPPPSLPPAKPLFEQATIQQAQTISWATFEDQ